MTYKVHSLDTKFFSGTLNPKKLESILNNYQSEGWEFLRSISQKRRKMFIFKKESHFLIFRK